MTAGYNTLLLMCSSLRPYVHSNYKALYKTTLLCHCWPSWTSTSYRQKSFVIHLPVLAFNSACSTSIFLIAAPAQPWCHLSQCSKCSADVTAVIILCILISSEAEIAAGKTLILSKEVYMKCSRIFPPLIVKKTERQIKIWLLNYFFPG